VVPFGDETIPECHTGSCISSGFIAVEHATGQRSFNMTDDLFFKVFFCCETLRLESLPGGTLGLGDRSYRERICQPSSCSLDRGMKSQSGHWIYTFYALDLARSKAGEGSLVLWTGHAPRAYRTLDIRDWGTRRGATFTWSGRVRHRSFCNVLWMKIWLLYFLSRERQG
jgi:hypothetical protein